MNSPVHDTIRLNRRIDAPVADVWNAYADSVARAQWSVPAGEKLVYEQTDFREGGHDSYRCGPPETLTFRAEVEYSRIVPNELIVYSETVKHEGQPIATGHVTWEFESDTEATLVTITSQIVSFVGSEMIDGNRNGHTKALEQLGRHLADG